MYNIDMMINFINKLPRDVKKSITDQLKLLAWALGGINSYFKDELGLSLGIALAIVNWCLLQFFAHYIMYMVNREEKL